MSNRLKDKIVVVMGAGSVAPGWSNGKACAVTYARQWASIVCVDLKSERAEETADLIVKEGGTAIATTADATNEDDVQAVVDFAQSTYGRIDIMHNNVGVGGTSGTPDQISPDLWDREIAQNLTTAYLGIRCVVPAMRKAGGGVITNTSSLLAVRFLARPMVAYTTAKAAVEALTLSCATAYGRDNIRVNGLRIGFSETPMVMSALNSTRLSEEQRQNQLNKTRSKIPLRQEHGDAFDVANAAVFLASDEARHVTGVILNVDGGLVNAPL